MSESDRDSPFAGELEAEPLPRLLRSVVEINRVILENLLAGNDASATGTVSRDWDSWLKPWLGGLGPLASSFQQAQLGFWQSLLAAVESVSGLTGGSSLQVVDDSRFRDPEWQRNPLLKQLVETYQRVCCSYLALAESQPLEPALKRRLRFQLRYLFDALAPSNFFLINPEALRHFLESDGRSLVRGLENLAADLRRGRFGLSDESVFVVGDNLAATPGMVIYENHLIQLLHYRPRTPKVRSRPLLIVPPCINKFYILDLQARNSLVRYCLEQGFQLFLISWVNPDRRHRDYGWDDYVEQGVVRAVEITREICGEVPVNTLGYCIGGTLLACALALLRSRRRARWVSSATFLTTLLDFSSPGDLEVFIDERILAGQEREAAACGYVSGRDLFHTFSQLRAKDLIWTYVVNSYLKGLDPTPFDILYWNCDPVNLTPRFYHRLVRELYLENLLIVGKFKVGRVRVQLGRLHTPAYFLSTIDDHLVPWRNVFAGAAVFAGTREFVLGHGGHVAGVVNPPGKKKSFYLVGDRPEGGAEAWREKAQKYSGSWWDHWRRWLARRSGGWMAAPAVCGSRAFPPREPAPGSYVKQRIDFAAADNKEAAD